MQSVTGRIDQLRATQARVHDGLEQLVPRHEAASTLRGLRDHAAHCSRQHLVRLRTSSAADSVVSKFGGRVSLILASSGLGDVEIG